MIEIEFLSDAILAQHSGEQKIEFLVTNLKKGKILVLESPLSHGEEARLIEATMKKITNSFSGIEIGTFGGTQARDLRGHLIKMLGGKSGGLTVIGPSHIVRQIRRNPETLSLLAGEGGKR